MSSIIFMIVGLIFLVGVIITSTYEFSEAIYEVLDIIAWVFIWEAVDTFFMERHKKRVEKIKYAKIAVSEIIFV